MCVDKRVSLWVSPVCVNDNQSAKTSVCLFQSVQILAFIEQRLLLFQSKRLFFWSTFVYYLFKLIYHWINELMYNSKVDSKVMRFHWVFIGCECDKTWRIACQMLFRFSIVYTILWINSIYPDYWSILFNANWWNNWKSVLVHCFHMTLFLFLPRNRHNDLAHIFVIIRFISMSKLLWNLINFQRI